MSPNQRALCGYKEIRAYLHRTFNFAPSRSAFHRLRSRDEDPIPCREQLSGHRQRIVASEQRIDAWARRNLLATSSPTSSSTSPRPAESSPL